MIYLTWLLIIFPIGWFMFFMGVALCNSKNTQEDSDNETIY